MNKSEYIAQLLGLNSLPTESSGKGAWGAYESEINGDQLRQLQELMGYIPPPIPFLGGSNLLGNGGYIPLTGTSGGLRAEQAGEDDNYRLSYTPNAEGTNMALHQSDIAGSKNTDMLGTAIVGGILGAGALGLGGGGASQYASVSEALAAGDYAAADAMAAAAFDAGGGISGMGSSFGSTGVGLDGLTFDGVPMEGDTGWSTMNTSVNDVAGNTWNPSLSASENLGIPQASFGAPAGATPIYGTLPSGVEGITGYQLANGAIVSANDIALGVGGVGSSLIGGGGASSWLTDMFGKEGASLVKSIAPDLWKAVVGGFATDSQKKDFEKLANDAAAMANPGAAFQRNTIWPALEEAIKTGNKPNAQTLAGLHQLMQSGADPNSDLRKQSANGFAAANDLVTNPMGNSGYSLADQAAQLYASLNSDPYSNPLISQTFQNAMEAAARKSAASGRLQGGNFLADSRNATTGAVVDASGKLGTQYGNAINSGMNMYDTQFKDALGLGTGAAGTANQNITAGGSGLSNLANLQQADSNYIAQLGNLAGFGKPENAAAAYAANQGAANKIDPWATALYNGGTKIIDSLISKW